MGKQAIGKKLGITWTDETVNPLVGCKAVSPGCLNCWAADMSPGLLAKGQSRHSGLAVLNNRGHGEWTGRVNWKPDELLKFSLGRARRIFLNSISDTFYVGVEREWQDQMFKAMRDNPQHEYQVLTKRPAGMLKYVANGTYLAYPAWLLGVQCCCRGNARAG